MKTAHCRSGNWLGPWGSAWRVTAPRSFQSPTLTKSRFTGFGSLPYWRACLSKRGETRKRLRSRKALVRSLGLNLRKFLPKPADFARNPQATASCILQTLDRLTMRLARYCENNVTQNQLVKNVLTDVLFLGNGGFALRESLTASFLNDI